MAVKVLVISPHPDDETLGAGGTLLRHIACGDEVYWCVVTHAFADSTEAYCQERLLMIEKVSQAYGFAKYLLLGFPAAALDTVPMRCIIDALSKVIQEVKPVIVYSVGDSDVNTDHDIVYRALMVATKPVYTPFIQEILLYEVPSSTNWAFPDKSVRFQPNTFVDISKFVERKITIMRYYGEEIKTFPHARSEEGVTALAIFRGVQVGITKAEGFRLIRKTIR